MSLSSRAVAAALLCLLVAHGTSCSKQHKTGHKAHAAPTTPPPGTPPAATTPPPPSSTSNSSSSSNAGDGWLNARATWYGAPNGAGPDDNGGACGFKGVNLPPFSAMTSCGNEPLFKDGKGCGSCYQIRCLAHPACSGIPETVIITDMNYYPVAPYHLDLSGTAFGAMAKDGRNDELRHAGIIDIQFKRLVHYIPLHLHVQSAARHQLVVAVQCSAVGRALTFFARACSILSFCIATCHSIVGLY
jgi:hypothetical protein